MKVTYVSHACLLIDTGTSQIATDPWFDGPAFCDQWNVFPKPIHSDAVAFASVYLISHPHEDHLHEPTLRRLCREPKQVFYPFYWYPETITWLRSLGLGEVIEARSGRSYSVDKNTSVTFIGAPGQNSIIVVEAGGEVFVNVNDALHSESNSLIDLYVAKLKRRWPKIDVVFCGFGGASYYPNALHAPAKNDHEIARLREQLFIHNFCRIVHGLAPRVAIPFAADFVLLAPHQRWINEVRFSREDIPAYYAKHFGQNSQTSVYAMYPGDRLVNGVLEPSSPYRAQLQNGRLDHLIAEQYPRKCRPSAPRRKAIQQRRNNGLRAWLIISTVRSNSTRPVHSRVFLSVCVSATCRGGTGTTQAGMDPDSRLSIPARLRTHPEQISKPRQACSKPRSRTIGAATR